MNDINKQRFLAELAQLLTFMYEEDRQEALSLYAGMFEEAEDEQALVQALVSPIRQAVLVARAYNATERKLQAHSQRREESAPRQEGEPDYLRAIYEIRAEALGNQPAPVVEDENQFSLFDTAETPVWPETPAAGEEEAPAAAPPEEEPEAPAEAQDEESEPAAGESAEPEADDAPAEKSAPAAEEPEASGADQVDAFLADFSLPSALEEAAEAPAESAEEAPADEENEDGQWRDIAIHDPDEQPEPRTVRKPRILLLIPYILLAVPVTLLGIALLLIPTLLSLSLAAACISVGIMTVSSAFGGFAVLADLLVVLGAALILLALGLLFLWLFVWFIGGAIAGLVRGVVELGGHWCYKEVPAI